MNCTNCGHELTPTTVFRFVDGVLGFQPGLECHNCLNLYDINGNMLMDANDEPDEAEEGEEQ